MSRKLLFGSGRNRQLAVSAGPEQRDYVPEPGNTIFFSWDNENGLDGSIDHVGIVEKVEDGYVHTIEGNAYEMVMRRKYKLGWYEILGYGKPIYF